MSKNPNNRSGLSGKAIAWIFVVYSVLYAMVAALVLFGVKVLLGPIGITVLAVGSIVVPAIATFIHVRKGKKGAVNDIAKRRP